VTDCFWDTETSSLTNMCGYQGYNATGCDDSDGKTTDEMQTAITFFEAGWDFVDETENCTEDIWWILEGQIRPAKNEDCSCILPETKVSYSPDCLSTAEKYSSVWVNIEAAYNTHQCHNEIKIAWGTMSLNRVYLDYIYRDSLEQLAIKSGWIDKELDASGMPRAVFHYPGQSERNMLRSKVLRLITLFRTIDSDISGLSWARFIRDSCHYRV